MILFMVQTAEIKQLEKLSSRVRAAAAVLIQETATRDALIISMSRDGMSGRALSLVADLTEGRIYQILRAGRGATAEIRSGAYFRTEEDGTLHSAVILREDEEGFTLEEI